MQKLPEFQGYTVDVRLGEFRKVEYGKLPEFVAFDSPKGHVLLDAMYVAAIELDELYDKCLVHIKR